MFNRRPIDRSFCSEDISGAFDPFASHGIGQNSAGFLIWSFLRNWTLKSLKAAPLASSPRCLAFASSLRPYALIASQNSPTGMP